MLDYVQRNSAMLRTSIDPASLYTLKRFGVRLALVSVFALAQIVSPLGFGKGLELLLGFTALVCAITAITKREHVASRTLGHWDEAALFLMLGVGVHFIAFHLLQN